MTNQASVETVGIVGGGLHGSVIAESVAVAGVRALVYEPATAPLERSQDRVAASLDRAVSGGKLTTDDAGQALQRIAHTTELGDLLPCELVIEAVTEDEWVKAEVFRRLDATMAPEVILASNPSSIPIANLAAATSRPDRVLGLHFFSPVPAIRLVEVVPAPETSPEAVIPAEAFAGKIGKHPIRSKDRAGWRFSQTGSLASAAPGARLTQVSIARPWPTMRLAPGPVPRSVAGARTRTAVLQDLGDRDVRGLPVDGDGA